MSGATAESACRTLSVSSAEIDSASFCDWMRIIETLRSAPKLGSNTSVMLTSPSASGCSASR